MIEMSVSVVNTDFCKHVRECKTGPSSSNSSSQHPSVGYSSHGIVSSLAEIEELEEERDNEWFDDAGLDLEKTRAIWVTCDPKYALRYNHSTSLHEFPSKRPEDVDVDEWEEWKLQLKHPTEHVYRIPLKGGLRA